MGETKTLYKRPDALTNNSMSFCPGCSHGLVNKLIAEIIDEFDIREKTLIVAPVGCAVMIYNHIDCDTVEAPHGRAPALATGMKRAKPDNIIVSYQGDGDLLAIGMAETIHAANRGENITVIFINNAIYGMTGGQMAPTTLINQKTMTSPAGRNPANEGYPIGACELLNTLTAPYYIERCKVNDSKSVIKTKNALRKAFKNQIEKKGYSFVEILSTCPTNWGLSPVDSNKWVEKSMTEIFPLGNFRDNGVKNVK
jgi:2-oxoglutarate ferredoxin oxidoreductase subunit beta